LDEQCIADIAACIVSKDLIERSKEALDQIYDRDSPRSAEILTALDVYGGDKVAAEIKYCIDEILKLCQANQGKKLRNIVFLGVIQMHFHPRLQL
jgi:hypothetical protein